MFAFWQVGWWSDEISDRFTVEEKEIKLASDIDVLTWSSKNVADKFPSVSYKDLEGLTNTVYDTKIVLSYPFGDKIESVDFEGYFISSSRGHIYRYVFCFTPHNLLDYLKILYACMYVCLPAKKVTSVYIFEVL